jgi:hypothetical protein
MKDIIKETVEAIMRHEKAYGTIDPEFARRLLATALEEQKAAERTRTIESVLELLVDRKPVDYPNGMPEDALLYGRDEGYNQCITELRAKLEAMKGSDANR